MDENLVIDSLQTSRFPLWCGKTVWSFPTPLWCNKDLPGRSASTTIAFEFFGLFVSTRTPSVFLGWKGKVVLVFDIVYLFFDLQVVFFGQMTSIINSIFFQKVSDWLIVCHWWAGIFVNKFRHFARQSWCAGT